MGPARRIGHETAAVGVVALLDEAAGLAFGAETERFVGQHFIDAEAAMQFDDIDVLIGLMRCRMPHRATDCVHCRSGEAARHADNVASYDA